MYTILLVTQTILVIFMIALILIQRSSSDGLGSLGGGGNQFLTGRSQANLLTRTTAILAGAFMVISLILAVMANRMTENSIVDAAAPVEESAPAPIEAPAPAAPAVPKGE